MIRPFGLERVNLAPCRPLFGDSLRPLSSTMTSAAVARCIHEVLPEEVFGVIFEEHAKLEWRAPLIDGQVCRQWRQTILRSPRVWAHLHIVQDFTSAPSKLHQWLDRSGSVPLHIQARPFNWNRGVEEVLNQHRKRIQSILLYSPSITFLENHSLPILQSLTIVGNTSVIRWSTCGAMPALRSLRARSILMGALPSNIFPPLEILALYRVGDCDSIIRHSYHSLASLMLSSISLPDTSESLEFPSLRFLSLDLVRNLKHRMNVPALTTYHESSEMERESFPMPLPFLIEYGIFRLYDDPPFNVTKLHQCYPNISRLSVRAYASAFKQLLHSLSEQPTALPMLRILAVDDVFGSMKYSGEEKDRMMKEVSVRNMASSVKMELCFDGRVRFPLYFVELCFNGSVQFPLYFGSVRVYTSSGRRKLTSSLRARVFPIEDEPGYPLLGTFHLFSVCGYPVDPIDKGINTHGFSS